MYPPYKNLIPRFLEEKEKKGIKPASTVLFVGVVIFSKKFLHNIMKIHHFLLLGSASNCTKERGKHSRKIDLQKIEYLMVNSWKECL